MPVTTMGRFFGKRVLVTGAAAGIGRAVALAFADEGAELVLADRNADGLAELASRIGPQAQVVVYDAMLPGDGDRLVSEATTRPLHVLVNVAGVYHRSHFTDTTDADWDRVMRINLTSPFEICRAAIPALLESGGNIVNTSSASAVKGIAYAAPYAITKSGIALLTKSLAAEYGHRGLRVNAVAPGRTFTDLGKPVPPVQGLRPEIAMHPSKMKGMIDGAPPEMIAGAYLWLASDAAAYVSGELHLVDGAYTCG